ncbi:hypothetical protein [Oceanobacillus senegalensis]|uniref:hypothetical protein n=1 Tax=Oceanobacillus senegalensis TaxID=1936063 RepID=UPI000A30AD43|nr:hypothetical protein [Oceanobacillus senegalensis]
MKEWWRRKKAKTRKSRKSRSDYTFFDFILDVLFWAPELILFPIRIIYWLVKGVGRFIFDV